MADGTDPCPLHLVIDIDGDGCRAEEKITNVHVGYSGAKRQRQADKGATNETVTDQAQ